MFCVRTGNLLARLAIINLTHEAKGLDSYAYTKEKFGKAQDLKSLEVLEHNVQEEVFHVASGLRWFKYVCEELQLEPRDQFHSLSRQYFKGKLKPPFNKEFRDQAGLTEDWYSHKLLAVMQRKWFNFQLNSITHRTTHIFVYNLLEIRRYILNFGNEISFTERRSIGNHSANSGNTNSTITPTLDLKQP